MLIFRIVTLASLCLLIHGSTTPSLAASKKLQIISKRLQQALNQRQDSSFESIFYRKQSAEIRSKQISLLNRFPNTKWSVRPSIPLKDGRPTLNILISSNKESRQQQFTFKAEQKFAITTINEKILDQELISEYSILRSGNKNLPVRLGIPDVVLTGTKYDVDVILENPLEDSVIAGGLVGLSPTHIQNQINPPIKLTPLRSGGLFKSVQAPLTPGIQRWSAIIAHPEGIISITKMIKVVSKLKEI